LTRWFRPHNDEIRSAARAAFQHRSGHPRRECLRVAQKHYEATDGGRKVQQEAQARYSASPKGQAFEKAYMRDFYRRPEVMEAARVFCRAYYKRPEVKARWKAMEAERRALELSATPPWLSDSQRAAIKAIYAESTRLERETGIPRHVDHIVPLKHPDVCGLHVPLNLQVLTASENLSKNNHFDGTMNNEGWRERLAQKPFVV
jgi:5-methylcytosine-specific restriction endonuclease McrA